jgi:hypothetical protein
MKDLKQQLVAGDPVAREGELDIENARTIRHRILFEARTQTAKAPSWWLRPLAVAGALVVCLLLAITIGRRFDSSAHVPPSALTASPARQMQFAAPGGTRIIWTFHQELDL